MTANPHDNQEKKLAAPAQPQQPAANPVPAVQPNNPPAGLKVPPPAKGAKPPQNAKVQNAPVAPGPGFFNPGPVQPLPPVAPLPQQQQGNPQPAPHKKLP